MVPNKSQNTARFAQFKQLREAAVKPRAKIFDDNLFRKDPMVEVGRLKPKDAMALVETIKEISFLRQEDLEFKYEAGLRAAVRLANIFDDRVFTHAIVGFRDPFDIITVLDLCSLAPERKPARNYQTMIFMKHDPLLAKYLGNSMLNSFFNSGELPKIMGEKARNIATAYDSLKQRYDALVSFAFGQFAEFFGIPRKQVSALHELNMNGGRTLEDIFKTAFQEFYKDKQGWNWLYDKKSEDPGS